jgi:replicative DNA helicase
MRPDQRPKLSDLRESGSIEQDADVVMFIHRPPFDETVERPDVIDVNLLIEKHRNGPTGEIPLRFHSRFVSYNELDEHYSEMAELEPAVAGV